MSYGSNYRKSSHKVKRKTKAFARSLWLYFWKLVFHTCWAVCQLVDKWPIFQCIADFIWPRLNESIRNKWDLGYLFSVMPSVISTFLRKYLVFHMFIYLILFSCLHSAQRSLVWPIWHRKLSFLHYLLYRLYYGVLISMVFSHWAALMSFWQSQASCFPLIETCSVAKHLVAWWFKSRMSHHERGSFLELQYSTALKRRDQEAAWFYSWHNAPCWTKHVMRHC